MTGKVLVAGIGNIFLGDDGFGVEVAARLARAELPDGVSVVDYGIRGMHLAYDLANGFDAAILVDATPRGGAPGTVYVIEPGPGSPAAEAGDDAAGTEGAAPAAGAAAETDAAGTDAAETDAAEGTDGLVASPLFDAHGMQPDVVFGMLDMLGAGRPGKILIVGCEPASVDYGMGLSDAVAASVDEAVRVVLDLAANGCAGWEENQGTTATQGVGRAQLSTEGWTHVPWHSR